MGNKSLKEICVESCESNFDYIEAHQFSDESMGRVMTKVEDFDICGEHVILTLGKKVRDTSSLGLTIGNKLFYEPDVTFDRFDELSSTVVLFPSENVMPLLNKEALSRTGDEIHLIVDLKWLIDRTKDYYKNFGDLIELPESTDKKEIDIESIKFPEGMEPSEEQKEAVKTILSSDLSYIWGAPGTGKTQFVLATAMMELIRKVKRVAIFAPTNNAVEQVLRGLLKIIEIEDPHGIFINVKKDILRLGMATSEFIKDYPDVCENKEIQGKLHSKINAMRMLEEVIFERKCDVLKAHFDEIEVLMGEEYADADYSGKKRVMKQVRTYIREIKAVLSESESYKNLTDDFDEYNVKTKAKIIADTLYNRPRAALDIEMYKNMTNEELDELMEPLRKEVEELERFSSSKKAEDAKVLAMTPQVFMGRFAPIPEIGDKMLLNADHIFVDEVGYCNLINILPLFAENVPITMLGDHLQLPPVCAVERSSLEDGIKNDNSMRYGFMWDIPALFAEPFFTKGIEWLQNAYLEDLDPVFELTRRADLTVSHRFGNNFAEILNDCIYMNGITGVSQYPLAIECLDAVAGKRETRANYEEVKVIGEFLIDNPMEDGEYIILTPYTAQVNLLKNSLPEVKENVLTVHGSQGREWDTVILSVADSGTVEREVQLRFTSTMDESSIGRKVINTAVSWAKKNLIVVCDKKFWSAKEGELIGRLATYAE